MLSKPDKNDRILVLSPHLDDAVLSAGGLIDRAVESGSAVVVGTIFTANAVIEGEASPLVRELHEWWGLGPNPYEVRREEDIDALRTLGAEYLHGGLSDSIYRRDKTGRPLYPTRQSVFSQPSLSDGIGPVLRKLISGWVETFKPTAIIAPMAVGRHVDHVVTTEAVRAMFAEWQAALFLYEDMPYSTGRFPPKFPDSVPAARHRLGLKLDEAVTVEVKFDAKYTALSKYASQIAEIFPDRDPEQELRRYMQTKEGTGLTERYWKVLASGKSDLHVQHPEASQT
jgi:LmbE family N-acetylglucosaminyl deacetylase